MSLEFVIFFNKIPSLLEITGASLPWDCPGGTPLQYMGYIQLACAAVKGVVLLGLLRSACFVKMFGTDYLI